MQYPTHEFYNCELVLSDDQTYRIDANWLHNQDLDHWQGWACEAGHSRLYIDTDNNVYGGQCLNDHLGNLDLEWKLLDRPTVCGRSRCTGCTDDLMVTKHKIGSVQID